MREGRRICHLHLGDPPLFYNDLSLSMPSLIITKCAEDFNSLSHSDLSPS